MQRFKCCEYHCSSILQLMVRFLYRLDFTIFLHYKFLKVLCSQFFNLKPKMDAIVSFVIIYFQEEFRNPNFETFENLMVLLWCKREIFVYLSLHKLAHSILYLYVFYKMILRKNMFSYSTYFNNNLSNKTFTNLNLIQASL